MSNVSVYIENEDFVNDWVDYSSLINIFCRKLGLSPKVKSDV